MIDIHCHILPQVDDGSKSLEESIEMAKIAQNEGIKKIINTSHYHPDFKYKSGEELKTILKSFNKKLKDENIDIEVLLGNELYFTDDLLCDFEKLEFHSLNNSKYILVEFSPNNFPNNLADIVYELKLKRYIPILAHVERYPKVQENPNIICDCINEGALIQLNGASVIGKNGKEAEKTSKILLENNMVHFIATDAHSSTKRRPLIKEVYDHISKQYGEENAKNIFEENQKCILENKDICILEPTKYIEKKNLFKRLFKR
ncbi:tyrosine-protein phosphatase [Paraclostridium bifermentans]|uniref:tyrosine-protein phosphatase n=1 Tax=Paraclostridium bifermentans TaxID=1490 RepID=UPI001C7F5316|nr:CpsB/CapC family capsule biosynthesis tyrosine phosphatase [Paraclostridium bifermentans]GIM32010.1 tyrosine protein phosphatase [Paraclostridium bifermentans subsp. muricolitidis]